VKDSSTVAVQHVERVEDGSTWHYTDSPLEINDVVQVNVDWDRRFDHMQHHSGQHLITAVAIKMFGIPTAAWSLTTYPLPCFLDLDITDQKMPDINKTVFSLEKAVNTAIRSNHLFSASVYTPEEFKQLSDIRFKSIPETEFPVRVVRIDGLDENMCCGTHVDTTAELQSIKLFHSELMSKKGSSLIRIHFAVGNRLLAILGSLYDDSKSLTEILSSAQHVERVQSLVSSNKSQIRVMKSLHQELAQLLPTKLIADAVESNSKMIFHYQKDGNQDFAAAFLKSISTISIEYVVLVLFGEMTPYGDGSGSFVLTGPVSLMDVIGNCVLSILSAKGGGKTRFQGKIPKGMLTAKSLDEVKLKTAALVDAKTSN